MNLPRSPIQPLLGLSDILRSGLKDAEQIELIDIIIRNAKRLRRLAEDILDVTRIEGQTLKLNKELFNLSDLIVQSIQDRKNQFDKVDRNLKIMYEPREDDIFVIADRERINQVISNLLDNAIKFTKKGTISINLEKKDSREVIVSVKDTGTGIDPKILPKLFSKFATKSEIGGTGLGLFIAKSIIESHGGKIWAKNNADGRGATFSVSFRIFNQSTEEKTKLVN